MLDFITILLVVISMLWVLNGIKAKFCVSAKEGCGDKSACGSCQGCKLEIKF